MKNTTELPMCYVWHEGEGELNANIFASCVVDYVKEQLSCDKEVIIFSDGCASQNRNVTLSNALSLLAREKKVQITQKYLEKGHTQMECDSVHATIERHKKRRNINTPAQFVEVIEHARIGHPYRVKYLSHEFFKDYNKLHMYSSIRPGRKIGDPTVCDLRAVRYLPNGRISWKLDHSDDEWHDLLQTRAASNQSDLTDDSLMPLYSAPIKIKHDKFCDLQSLKAVILSDYHLFYDSLCHF
jgi:hypothetical protein